jgi:hypothetical protein
MSKDGMKATICGNGTLPNGAKIANPKRRTEATASAERLCHDVADRSNNDIAPLVWSGARPITLALACPYRLCLRAALVPFHGSSCDRQTKGPCLVTKRRLGEANFFPLGVPSFIGAGERTLKLGGTRPARYPQFRRGVHSALDLGALWPLWLDKAGKFFDLYGPIITQLIEYQQQFMTHIGAWKQTSRRI